MDLKTYFSVTDRTLRRWEVDGADLGDAESLCRYLRNLMRPSPTVEARIHSPTFEADVERIIQATDHEVAEYDPMLELAGDPAFNPHFDLSGLPGGACYKPSRFSARVLSEIKVALTGVEIMVRLLEDDQELEAYYGDAREVFADGGSPVDDRDLMSLLFVTENMLSAQVHRLKACYRKVTTGVRQS